jgi:hypothetical protein
MSKVATPPNSPPSENPCNKRRRIKGWRRSADALVAGEKSDQQRRDAHYGQGGDQRFSASDAIAEIAEEYAAEWPGNEPDRERA